MSDNIDYAMTELRIKQLSKALSESESPERKRIIQREIHAQQDLLAKIANNMRRNNGADHSQK